MTASTFVNIEMTCLGMNVVMTEKTSPRISENHMPIEVIFCMLFVSFFPQYCAEIRCRPFFRC